MLEPNRHSRTVIPAAAASWSDRCGNLVEEAQHGLDATGVIDQGDVESDDRCGLAGGPQFPAEADLVVVAVDRPGQPEHETRELLLHSANGGKDRLTTLG